MYFIVTQPISNIIYYIDAPEKVRSPAWCDRIMFKTHENTNQQHVEVLKYACMHGIYQSDHRAVMGHYKIYV